MVRVMEAGPGQLSCGRKCFGMIQQHGPFLLCPAAGIQTDIPAQLNGFWHICIFIKQVILAVFSANICFAAITHA